MLTPTYLDELPEPMIELVGQLQDEIIADVSRRIAKCRILTPSAEWQLYKANQLRLSSAEINKRISKFTKIRQRTVKALYTDAVKEALKTDAEIYRYAIAEEKLPAENGEKLTSYFRNVAFSDTFRQGLKSTDGLMRNLTNSMAATANRMLSDALDLAWLESASGAYTPDEAVFKAVSDLTAKGLTVVQYSSGHADQVDVAVRRAVRTGINKTCCDMQLELAGEMGSDLVEITSHLGARPTHAEWQGLICSLSGKNPRYPDFKITGYGTGDGLGGWNCRHSFYPYFEGISEAANAPTFSKEENAEYYDLTQQQRAYERAIRQSKRELAGLDSARQSTEDTALKAKLDKAFERKSATLKNRENRLSEFCKNNGLLQDGSRVRAAGFGRSEAQKAVWAAKRYENNKSVQSGLTSGTQSGTINSVQKSELGQFKTKIQSDSRMTKEYYDCIKTKFSHGSDIAKKAFNKYVPVDSVADSAYEGTANYNSMTKKIYIHYGSDLNNLRGNGATWFHEHGHLIDDACGKLSQDNQFRILLDNDKLNYVKRVGKEQNIKTFPKAYQYISNELSDYRKHSAVSDILHGLSDEQIQGCGIHARRNDGSSYWNDESILSEAFAHMYEAQYDKVRYKEMEKIFPNALKYFEKKLEEAVK